MSHIIFLGLNTLDQWLNQGVCKESYFMFHAYTISVGTGRGSTEGTYPFGQHARRIYRHVCARPLVRHDVASCSRLVHPQT